MTRVIWKFEIPFHPSGDFAVPMSKDAVVLKADTQHGIPCMWVELDPENAKEEVRRFAVVGTGWKFNNGQEDGLHLKYVDTFQMAKGQFVWHIYELKIKGG